MNSKIILDLVSQEAIFSKYIGSVSLKKRYCNPFRADKNPRCYFEYKNGNLRFVDYGNDIAIINCFQACMYYYNCSYKQAINYIDIDFKLNLNPYTHGEVTNSHIRIEQSVSDDRKDSEKSILNYSFVYQDFKDYDIQFWKKYKYTKELVDLMKIRSVKHIYKNNILWKTSFKGNSIFTYSDSKGEFKIYQPQSDKFNKWRSIRSTLEGYELLPDKGDLLFITSSYKDVGALKILGYYAIAPSSENSFTLLYQFLPELKERFKTIYVFHNNDEPGKKASLKITKEQDLNYINLPNSLLDKGIKDPSDLISYNEEKLKEIIKEKLKRDGK